MENKSQYVNLKKIQLQSLVTNKLHQQQLKEEVELYRKGKRKLEHVDPDGGDKHQEIA